MGYGAVEKTDLVDVFLGVFNSFTNSIRDVVGLAHADAYGTFAVAHGNQRVKAEPPSAFYHFSDTAYRDEPIGQFSVAARRHSNFFIQVETPFLHYSELQTFFARRLSQGLYSSVIRVTFSIEHNFFNTFFLGLFGDQLTDHS